MVHYIVNGYPVFARACFNLKIEAEIILHEFGRPRTVAFQQAAFAFVDGFVWRDYAKPWVPGNPFRNAGFIGNDHIFPNKFLMANGKIISLRPAWQGKQEKKEEKLHWNR